MSEPVVVLLKSDACHHCKNLTAIWDKVTLSLKEVNPRVRFFTVTLKDNNASIDTNTTPKGLIRYTKWYPMILLVPGKLWDEAMSKLGPSNPVELKDGVQVLNANWEGSELKYAQKWDIRKPEEFGKWLKDSMEKEDFKSASNAQAIPNIFKSSVPFVGAKSTAPNSGICSMKIISRPK